MMTGKEKDNIAPFFQDWISGKHEWEMPLKLELSLNS